MKSYGIEWVGGKTKILKDLFDVFPKADCFVDLFTGGGSVAHYAVLSGKYNRVIVNDLNLMSISFLKNAINGRYQNKRAYISRNVFHKLKTYDPFVRYLWSFGSNGKDYMYGEGYEVIERALHYVLFFNDFRLLNKIDIRLSLKLNKTLNKVVNYQDREKIIRSVSGKRMLHIEKLRRLNNLIELKNKNIKFYSTQYDLVPIPENSVIYCDIPYKGTFDYGMDFDYEKFYKWAKNQNNIFISEYDMPNDFVCVKKIYKECSFAKNNSNLTIEKLFIPKR